MPATWTTGAAVVEQMLAESKLTRVVANRGLADEYIAQALTHIISARAVRESDPQGAFQLAYDAARKGLAAVLINQGLRPGGMGAHATTQEAVAAQLGNPEEIARFAWMRRTRNSTEYPDADSKVADSSDATDAINFASDILDKVSKVLDLMPPFPSARR